MSHSMSTGSTRPLRRVPGTPEIGGLTPREALAILRGLAGLDIVGGDVVEVAPQYDATTNTAHVGAQMLFTELCLVAANPKRAPPGRERYQALGRALPVCPPTRR